MVWIKLKSKRDLKNEMVSPQRFHNYYSLMYTSFKETQKISLKSDYILEVWNLYIKLKIKKMILL